MPKRTVVNCEKCKSFLHKTEQHKQGKTQRSENG